MIHVNDMSHKWNEGYTIKITSIDGLLVFEGNKDMFQNFFFSNANWDQVVIWTDTHQLTITSNQRS